MVLNVILNEIALDIYFLLSSNQKRCIIVKHEMNGIIRLRVGIIHSPTVHTSFYLSLTVRHGAPQGSILGF